MTPEDQFAREIAEMFGETDEKPTLEMFSDWLNTGAPPNNEIISRYGFGEFKNFTIRMHLRNKFIREFGFAIPCKEAIDLIAGSGPVIEVGAGTGYWSALIKNAGGDIIASDNYDGGYGFQIGRYFDVSRSDGADFVKRYPERNVLMSWVTYDNNWGYRVLEAMRSGTKVFLIGEGCGGCTGDDQMFEYLSAHFNHPQALPIPTWAGIHDYLQVAQKK